MTLADDLTDLPVAESQPCKFGKALAAFPDEADAILALAQPGEGSVRRRRHLIATMTKHGHPFGTSMIDRHLAGDCGCPR